MVDSRKLRGEWDCQAPTFGLITSTTEIFYIPRGVYPQDIMVDHSPYNTYIILGYTDSLSTDNTQMVLIIPKI